MNTLIGIWFYSSLIFQGQPLPRPNPDLKMYFNFLSESRNEIFYYRTGESGQCRRVAEYAVSEGKLYQKVVSVDDTNAAFCSDDTDMQLGKESVSSYEIKDGKLLLQLPLGDENIIFVWEKN